MIGILCSCIHLGVKLMGRVGTTVCILKLGVYRHWQPTLLSIYRDEKLPLSNIN